MGAQLMRPRAEACPTCEAAPDSPAPATPASRKRIQRRSAAWDWNGCTNCDAPTAPAEREADASSSALMSGSGTVSASESPRGGEPTGALRSTLEGAAGGGVPLPDMTRQMLEPGLHTTLDDVRIHADGHAHRLATQLGAEAFTYGSDVYFRDGAYDPSGARGRETLAHEVVHTVQQRAVEPAIQRQEHATARRSRPARHARPGPRTPTLWDDAIATLRGDDSAFAAAVVRLDTDFGHLAERIYGISARPELFGIRAAYQASIDRADRARTAMAQATFLPVETHVWFRQL